MTKDPAFLFYSNDFSSGTQFFTDEQVGKYIRLMIAQHQHGHLSEKQVLIICKSYDVEVMEKFTKDDEGKFYNVRLEFEINRRKSFTESRSLNKKGKTKSNDNDIKNKSKSYDFHMENENENENRVNKNKGEKKLKPDFELIFPFQSESFTTAWDVFIKFRKEIKKPLAKTSQQAQLKKLSEYPESVAIKMIEQSIANGWQGIFELKENTTNVTGNGKFNNNGKERPVAGRLTQSEIDRFDIESARLAKFIEGGGEYPES